MKDLKKDILSQIKKEKIEPVSKNIFVMKKIFLYIFLVLSVIIGAISFSIMLGYLLEADWFLTHRLGLMTMLQSYLSFFWGVFLIISIIIGFDEFKNTERGYKFHFWQIVLGNISLSIVLGAVLYFSGLSQIIENKIQTVMPQYREKLVGDKVSRMIEVWQNEDAGLLIGEVIEKLGENITLQDSNKKNWKIIISESTDVRDSVELGKGVKIKLMGEKKQENVFEAEEIRPFIGKGKRGEH